ncbi:hypothetical protein L6R52_33155 [Myxococcota bacterium]|nr:hypothetical protein [Myxococcota bacterium]
MVPLTVKHRHKSMNICGDRVVFQIRPLVAARLNNFHFHSLRRLGDPRWNLGAVGKGSHGTGDTVSASCTADLLVLPHRNRYEQTPTRIREFSGHSTFRANRAGLRFQLKYHLELGGVLVEPRAAPDPSPGLLRLSDDAEPSRGCVLTLGA